MYGDLYEGVAYALNRVFHHVPPDEDVAGLADAVGAVDGLEFYHWIPITVRRL